MNVCFFTENYYKGGLDTFLINLFAAWPNKKDKIYLMCNAEHPGLTNILSSKCENLSILTYESIWDRLHKTYRCDSRTTLNNAIAWILLQVERMARYPVLFPLYVFLLTRKFRKYKFDRMLIVNGGYPASLVCRAAVIAWKLAGNKNNATFNFHSSATSTSWYFSFFDYLIDLSVISLSNKIVGVSQAATSTLTKRRAFVGCDKLLTIYNGIQDPQVMCTDSLITNVIGHEDEEPYCLMLSTFHKYKGHVFLFRAFKEVVAEYPKLKLKICGHGYAHESNYILDSVKKNGLCENVELMPFNLHVTKLIKGAKLLVVPSQEFEAFGLTIVEAMALSVPFVATDVGGIPEVVEGSTAGYICSKSDPSGFASAIKKVLADPLHAKALGENGRRTYMEKYTATRMATQYYHLLCKP